MSPYSPNQFFGLYFFAAFYSKTALCFLNSIFSEFTNVQLISNTLGLSLSDIKKDKTRQNKINIFFANLWGREIEKLCREQFKNHNRCWLRSSLCHNCVAWKTGSILEKNQFFRIAVHSSRTRSGMSEAGVRAPFPKKILAPHLQLTPSSRFLAPRLQLAPPGFPDFPTSMYYDNQYEGVCKPLSSFPTAYEKCMSKMGLLSFAPKHVRRFDSIFSKIFQIIYQIWSSKVVLDIRPVMVSILSKLL